ncbi:MAG TPA: hypothetical protein VHG32_06945 [Thermoanaerobaculia bacterium]|jgi:hypothetical protein|nr:hypothetical protein [Thermoanaerobaculia bacterium]
MIIRPGSIVVVHLNNPTEKFWGVLQELAMTGVYLRGISLSSFDDWMALAVRGKDQTLGLCAMFVPLFRVERVFLDEPVGEVESYQQRFSRRVGVPVERYLGLTDGDAEGGADDNGEVPS